MRRVGRNDGESEGVTNATSIGRRLEHNVGALKDGCGSFGTFGEQIDPSTSQGGKFRICIGDFLFIGNNVDIDGVDFEATLDNVSERCTVTIGREVGCVSQEHNGFSDAWTPLKSVHDR